LLLIVLFGVVALRVHLLTNMRYGYFRDELYYIACALISTLDTSITRHYRFCFYE
jgi:hypothetical protein